MRFFLNFCGGMLLTLALLEIGFQFLPVNSGLRREATSEEKPYGRYFPNQSFVYSHGWSLLNSRQAVTNKQGFVNSSSFNDKQAEVLIVGDSFIESLMLDYTETVQGQLESKLGSGIYAVATSGNGLADSLVLLKNFVLMLKPKHIVIFVAPFELTDVASAPRRGHNGFVTNGVNVDIVHKPYYESSLKLMMSRSALLRYFYYNLKFPDFLSRTFGVDKLNITTVDAAGLLKKQKIIDYYLAELRVLQQEERIQITFLLDGDRGALYSADKSKNSPYLKDRDQFIGMAKADGFGVVDMQSVFAKHWITHKERFDFLPADGHWNAVAHKLAANALSPHLHQ